MIANGRMFGPNQPVKLHLLDIDRAKDALGGVVLELQDLASPLLVGIVATTDLKEATTGANYAVLLGGFPRLPGMERKDVMSKNVAIYKEIGGALSANADPNIKVLVVANPANTNANVLRMHAPNLKPENISALTRLDHNRAQAQIALKLGLPVQDIRNAVIWGNHSGTQYPAWRFAKTAAGGSVPDAMAAAGAAEWGDSEFVQVVQQRGKAILDARKLSSAMSAAKASCDHMFDWVNGTAEGEFVSMAVLSDGSYGVAKDVMFSFPVKCAGGNWEIVQGLEIDEFSRGKLDATSAELVEEMAMAVECLAE